MSFRLVEMRSLFRNSRTSSAVGRRRLLRVGGSSTISDGVAVFGSGEPQQPRCRHVHHEALEREGEKAEIARSRHLEDFPLLEHRKYVAPLGRRPVVPEFPQPSADKTRGEQ